MQKEILFWFFGLFIGLLVAFLFFQLTQVSVSQSQLKQEIESYFLKNFNISISVSNIQDTGTLYRVSLSFNDGTTLNLFASKDGKYLFLDFINLSAPVTTTSIPSFSPKASEVPDVKLFVMSFCPYGTQAELFMKPIYDSLKEKANFSLIFIVNVNGNNLSDVNSLHGPLEVLEDARQICIQKIYGKDVLWNYVENFDKNCYPNSIQNRESYLACALNEEKKLNINSTIIQNCMNSSDVIQVFKTHQALVEHYNVFGSPTLVINNSTYNDDFGRSSAAYQKAICLAFLSPPPFCSQNISSSTSSPTGKC